MPRGEEIGLAAALGSGYATVGNTAQCDWSPDGQKLACKEGSGEIFCSSIVIFSPTGSKLTSIPALEGCHQFGRPVWSPDGQWLAFGYDIVGGRPGVSMMKADGCHLTDLGRAAFAMAPAWLPEGKTLAFLSDWNLNQNIYTNNVDGTEWKKVTNSTAGVRLFAWQP